MTKEDQKRLIVEIMRADEKDGLYTIQRTREEERAATRPNVYRNKKKYYRPKEKKWDTT